jgi:LysM repeat protein
VVSNQPPSGQGPVKVTSRVLEPTYLVAPGDTLGTIAAKSGTSVEALQAINNLTDRNALSVGQKLVIPN